MEWYYVLLTIIALLLICTLIYFAFIRDNDKPSVERYEPARSLASGTFDDRSLRTISFAIDKSNPIKLDVHVPTLIQTLTAKFGANKVMATATSITVIGPEDVLHILVVPDKIHYFGEMHENKFTFQKIEFPVYHAM